VAPEEGGPGTPPARDAAGDPARRIRRTSAMTPIPDVDFDPFEEGVLADPYGHHARLRDVAPVFRLPKYGVYGMARHAEVTQALKDSVAFCSSRGVGLTDYAKEPPWRPPSILIEADPPLHDRTRRLMNGVVTLGALREARERWAKFADELVVPLVERRRFDAVKDLAEVFPLLIFPDTIGLRAEGRENMLPWAFAAFNAGGPDNRLRRESQAKAEKAGVWVIESCRRENLRPGGWGMAVYAAADRGECTPEEAAMLVRSFITAGVDTTINGIGNLLHAFAESPGEWERLREDPKRIRGAVEESLRWDSTAHHFFRTTTRDVDVGDQRIPEGSKVLLFLASANRDPRRWQDPERFDITRMTSGHVAFGYGIHQCLGQMVARQEMALILEALLPRVAAIRRVGKVERRPSNTLHALAGLPVEVDPV
jgi:cytochrome P450